MGPRNPSPDPKKDEGVAGLSASLGHLSLHSSPVDRNIPDLELSLAQISLNSEEKEERGEIKDEEENIIHEEGTRENEETGNEERGEKKIKVEEDEDEKSDDEVQLKDDDEKHAQNISTEYKEVDKYEVKEREEKETEDKENELCHTEVKQEDAVVNHDTEIKEELEEDRNKVETVKKIVVEEVSEEEDKEDEEEQQEEEEETSDDENPPDDEEEEELRKKVKSIPKERKGDSLEKEGKPRAPMKLTSRGLSQEASGYNYTNPYETYDDISTSAFSTPFMHQNEFFGTGQPPQTTNYVDMSPHHPAAGDQYMCGGSPQHGQTPSYCGFSPQHVGNAVQYLDSPRSWMPESPALSLLEEYEMYTPYCPPQVSNQQQQFQMGNLCRYQNQDQFQQQHQGLSYSYNHQQDLAYHEQQNQQQGMPCSPEMPQPYVPCTPRDSPQPNHLGGIEDVLEVIKRETLHPSQTPVPKEEYAVVRKIQEDLENLQTQNTMHMARTWPNNAYQLSWKMKYNEELVLDMMGTLTKWSDQEVVEKDEEGDTKCMIAACNNLSNPDYSETLMAMVRRQEDINICCEKLVDKDLMVCSVCGNADRSRFYSSLGMRNHQGHTIISTVVSLEYPPAVVNYLLKNLRPSDKARIFTPERCREYAYYVGQYPELRRYLHSGNGLY